MITELTPEQEALLPVYRDRWLKIGLDCGETDKGKAEEAIKLAYECAGLKPPASFIWTESPLHNGVAKKLLDEMHSVSDSVLESVRESVWDSVLESVRDSVDESVDESVWESVWGSVGDSVRESVRESVWGSVLESVRDSVDESVWESVWESVGDSCYGSHDAYWLGFYDYFYNVLKIKGCEKIKGLSACAKEVGWFMPFENAVIVSPKPKKITTTTNEKGKLVLHADGEPVIYYCDDFQVWAFHDTRLPNKKYHCHSSKWKAEWIDEEKNADVRTALLKGIGYDRWIAETGGETIHQETIFDLPYELIQRNDPDIGVMKFLKMKNPSVPGVFHIEPVAPYDWIGTCQDALRWRELGDDAEEPHIKVKHMFIK